MEAPAWVLWALFTPVIFRLGQRWPLDRRNRWGFACLHVVASVVGAILAATITGIVIYTPEPGRTLGGALRSRIALGAPANVVVYFIVLAVSYLAINTRRLRERELTAERLSKALTEAQLAALRMQLQPHFLFNSLNAVMALVRDNATDRADRALTLLSDVLRTSLRSGTRARTPLREELSFIRNYLEIETLRFGDRLQVRFTIGDGTEDAPVPTFVLQPIVENALLHGLLSQPDGGVLEIVSERRGGRLFLQVADTGAGLPSDWSERATRGVGIANLRARLSHMYGSAAALELSSNPQGPGARASIELPYEAPA